MYALLDTDNKTVIGYFPPDVSKDKILKEANGRMLIEMNLDNSPGYLPGIYENGKFYPTKESING